MSSNYLRLIRVDPAGRLRRELAYARNIQITSRHFAENVFGPQLQHAYIQVGEIEYVYTRNQQINTFYHTIAAAFSSFDRGIDYTVNAGSVVELAEFARDFLLQPLSDLRDSSSLDDYFDRASRRYANYYYDTPRDLYNNHVGIIIGQWAQIRGVSRDDLIDVVAYVFTNGGLAGVYLDRETGRPSGVITENFDLSILEDAYISRAWEGASAPEGFSDIYNTGSDFFQGSRIQVSQEGNWSLGFEYQLSLENLPPLIGVTIDGQVGVMSPFGMYGEFAPGAGNLSPESRQILIDTFDQLYALVPEQYRDTIKTGVTPDNRLYVSYDNGTGDANSIINSSPIEPTVVDRFRSHSLEAIRLAPDLLRHDILIDNVLVESITYREDVGGNLEAISDVVYNSDGTTQTVIDINIDPNTGLAIPSNPRIEITPEVFERLRNNEINIDQMNALYGQIGKTIGSSIGGLLSDELGLDGAAGVIADTISSAIFGQIGAAFGAGLDEEGSFLEAFDGNLKTAFGTQHLIDAIGSSGVGVVSSLLTAELTDALGLNGVAADLFGLASDALITNAGTAVFNNIVTNVTASLASGSGEFVNIFDDIDDLSSINPWTMVASYFGTQLGRQVIQPETQAGAILGSLDATISSIQGAQIGLYLGGPVGAVIGSFLGSFIGFIRGTLIGNLFGKKKPKIPTADASTVLNFVDGYYELGAVTSHDNGNESLATDMAETAAGTLNAFIGVVGGKDLDARNVNTVSPTQTYGHEGAERPQLMWGINCSVARASKMRQHRAVDDRKVVNADNDNMLLGCNGDNWSFGSLVA